MTHIPVSALGNERDADIREIRAAKETVELQFWPHADRMPDTGLALLAMHWASIPNGSGGVQSIVRRVPTLLDLEGVKALRDRCDRVIEQMESFGKPYAEEDDTTCDCDGCGAGGACDNCEQYRCVCGGAR
jgi:hypothetical protein